MVAFPMDAVKWLLAFGPFLNKVFIPQFHELFHYDHGPTLAAMIETIVDQAREQGRGLLIVIGIGFHFISHSPYDPGSTMAAFLPQVRNNDFSRCDDHVMLSKEWQ